MMHDEFDRLRAEYSSKSDDELLLLAEDLGSLTDQAQAVLRETMEERRLQLSDSESATEVKTGLDIDPLVTIRYFTLPVDASLAKTRLDSANIDAFLSDMNMARMNWLVTSTTGGIRLQVRAGDAEAATEILDSEFSANESGSPEKID